MVIGNSGVFLVFILRLENGFDELLIFWFIFGFWTEDLCLGDILEGFYININRYGRCL